MSSSGDNADQTSRRRKEAEKMEASLVRSIHIPGERSRVEKRIIQAMEDDPSEMIAALLRNYSSRNGRVAAEVHKFLDRITEDRKGMKAVLNDVVNPDREIRGGAVTYLKEKRGIYAVTYGAFLEHMGLLIALAKGKDIPVVDIEALVETSKESFLDGEMMEALKDIAASIDFLKHRNRAADQLKGYVTEMLRMVPDLTRLGVYAGRLEEPLRRAINASKAQALDETKEIIAIRGTESSIRYSLDKLVKSVRTSAKVKPSMMQLEQMQGDDVMAIMKLRDILCSVTQLAMVGKRNEGLLALQDYLKKDCSEYLSRAKKRVEEGDRSASIAVYTIGIVALKLASALMPQTAEDFYQKYYRYYEKEPSVHIVPWPETMIKLIS